MITLFRRIRQKLIASGSVTKYLLYAIGEILLVVIGILIALQVNNWNESKSVKDQEKIYLELIMDDLILQKEENDIQRTAVNGQLSIKDELTELIGNRFQVKESERTDVKKVISTLVVGRTYGAYEATFIDLTSSGNIGLISDQLLKNKIIQHYQIQRRDRDVINNNILNNHLELWTKLVERDVIMIAPNLIQFSTDEQILEFDSSYDFLNTKLFENLAKEENLILIQNVMAFKIAATGAANIFLDNSDDRINQLVKAIEKEMESL